LACNANFGNPENISGKLQRRLDIAVACMFESPGRDRGEGEEMTIINAGRIVAALLAAGCWFMSARVKMTRIEPGQAELDKVTLLADDLQAMGRWNAAAASFACVAALADALIAFGS
jgi:hypothetical protein